MDKSSVEKSEEEIQIYILMVFKTTNLEEIVEEREEITNIFFTDLQGKVIHPIR